VAVPAVQPAASKPAVTTTAAQEPGGTIKPLPEPASIGVNSEKKQGRTAVIVDWRSQHSGADQHLPAPEDQRAPAPPSAAEGHEAGCARRRPQPDAPRLRLASEVDDHFAFGPEADGRSTAAGPGPRPETPGVERRVCSAWSTRLGSTASIRPAGRFSRAAPRSTARIATVMSSPTTGVRPSSSRSPHRPPLAAPRADVKPIRTGVQGRQRPAPRSRSCGQPRIRVSGRPVRCR